MRRLLTWYRFYINNACSTKMLNHRMWNVVEHHLGGSGLERDLIGEYSLLRRNNAHLVHFQVILVRGGIIVAGHIHNDLEVFDLGCIFRSKRCLQVVKAHLVFDVSVHVRLNAVSPLLHISSVVVSLNKSDANIHIASTCNTWYSISDVGSSLNKEFVSLQGVVHVVTIQNETVTSLRRSSQIEGHQFSGANETVLINRNLSDGMRKF
mmetsp:Transcript_4283/g.16139  ORF Transcript_4283/g.16139 Transcript_4283/m.16139 type:complete len:208 (+) Transcript_4283:1029-1652(+)